MSKPNWIWRLPTWILGDPVGAHNLLQEVLQEGNDSQQQKARALLAKLPI